MKIGIIFFILAFVVRSWHSYFSKQKVGFQKYKAPKIMWSETGLSIVMLLGVVFIIVSFLFIYWSISWKWFVKLPIMLIFYWFFYWELPLILFQEPESKNL